MELYEISEDGRSGRVPRKALAFSCGVSFSVGAPLPGCAWLPHALRSGLQRSRRRGIFKIHEQEGFMQVLDLSDGVLGFSKTKF